MSKDDINRLSAEEQAEIKATEPRLWQALNESKFTVWGWVVAWRRARDGGQADPQAQPGCGQAPARKAKNLQRRFFGFPTDLTRCSPFFPLRACDLNTRRQVFENFEIMAANWGKATISGPQLSTYDEDVLLALLAFLDGQKYFKGSQFDQNGFTVYSGHILPIARLMGIGEHGMRAYTRILESLARMAEASVSLTLAAGFTKNNNPRSPRQVQINPILSGANWHAETKSLQVAVNPFFYQNYIAGRITLLDLSMRMRLSSPIAKALYRFMQSQRNPVFTCSLATLMAALNMDGKQPLWKNRQLLKAAIKSLVKSRVFSVDSGFLDENMIRLSRHYDALPGRKE